MSDQVLPPHEGSADGHVEWYEALEGNRPVVVVISGPSGVGKDATIQRMKDLGHPCHFVVTATTRERRLSETDGIDYHFLTDEEFTGMIEADEFLEYAVVYNQRKGIPKSEVRAALASGKDVVMRVDVQGAETVRRLVPQALTVFLTAESEEALIQRLKRRRTETAEELECRVQKARDELRRMGEFKYRVINRECALDETVEDVVAIMRAEKCRVDWQPVKL